MKTIIEEFKKKTGVDLTTYQVNVEQTAKTYLQYQQEAKAASGGLRYFAHKHPLIAITLFAGALPLLPLTVVLVKSKMDAVAAKAEVTARGKMEDLLASVKNSPRSARYNPLKP